jgi:hypothetical protein
MSLNKTARYSRHTYGDNGVMGKKNILSVSFVATELKKPDATSNTAVHAAISTSQGVYATATVTADSIDDGDTVTIDGRTYTFQTSLVDEADNVLIGASDAAALDNLKSAINATAGAGTTYGTGTVAHASVNATTNTDTTQVIQADVSGSAGNSIAVSASDASLVWGTATLEGGVDGTTTVTTAITNPDIPRNLIVKPGGTAADVKASSEIVITGTNVEGKTITETFTTVENDVTALVGSKAFKTVTSIVIPGQDGTGATFSVGIGNKLGIGLRNLSSMPIKIYTKAADGTEAIEDASASALSSSAVESNTVTPTTAPDGAVEMRVYVLNYKWHLNPTNNNPDYGV